MAIHGSQTGRAAEYSTQSSHVKKCVHVNSSVHFQVFDIPSSSLAGACVLRKCLSTASNTMEFWAKMEFLGGIAFTFHPLSSTSLVQSKWWGWFTGMLSEEMLLISSDLSLIVLMF